MMEPHMIDFVELPRRGGVGWKWIIFICVCDWHQSCGFHHIIIYLSIGNHAYNMYFFLCQDTVSINWRFLTSPPDGGFVRNDSINLCSVIGKHWRFALRIANASLIPHKILSFRALARNLIINCFEIIIDCQFSLYIFTN